MNTIMSDGGPIIGIERANASLWSGVFGNRFVGSKSPFVTDYDAAAHVSLATPPTDIGKVTGQSASALLISMPLETAIVSSTDTSLLIAQVHYADEDWSFEKLNTYALSDIEFDESVSMSIERGNFVFFDAASDWDSVGDEFLTHDLIGGDYEVSHGALRPDESTFIGIVAFKLR